MANVMVLAESGFGKSTSLCENKELSILGLDPKTTFLINVTDKPLPLRGFNKKYVEVPKGEPKTGNLLSSNDFTMIAKIVSYVKEKRSDIEDIVIDDLQYTMADYYMDNGKKGGYDVFKHIGFGLSLILKSMKGFKGNIFVLSHHETVQDAKFGTTYKAKTVGKMVDQYITLEGKFNVVLYGHQVYDKKNAKVTKQFVTNYDGQYPGKSPHGMFDLYIPNDLGYVKNKVREYYEGE